MVDGISRDQLSSQFRYSIGGLSTIFQVNAYLQDIKSLLGEKVVKQAEVVDETDPITQFYGDVQEKADEMIADLIAELDAYQFQHLVAAVLRAMKFQTRESAPGRDLGVDVLAHPDAFGFESPRIKVQVKHKRDQS